MADEVLRERRGHVEILTINRPEARNAINGAVSQAMSAAMDELTEDADCWVVVITGSGDKAFSAGMDLKAFSSGEGGDIMGGERRLRRPHPARLPQADHRRRERVGPGRRLRDHALVRPRGGRRPRHLRHPRGQARASSPAPAASSACPSACPWPSRSSWP